MFRNVPSKIREKINLGTSQAVMEIREQIRLDKEQKELSYIMKPSSHSNMVKTQANLARARST